MGRILVLAGLIGCHACCGCAMVHHRNWDCDAIERALASDSVRELKQLLDHTDIASTSVCAERIGCMLRAAASYGATNILAFLVSEGMDADLRDDFGRTAFHWAIDAGNDSVGDALYTVSEARAPSESSDSGAQQVFDVLSIVLAHVSDDGPWSIGINGEPPSVELREVLAKAGVRLVCGSLKETHSGPFIEVRRLSDSANEARFSVDVGRGEHLLTSYVGTSVRRWNRWLFSIEIVDTY